ncbi:MAG TPA: dihydroneopterin aldolase [Candidatus Polarisedimenticolia bacterium]|nr:dihydroneopterin aldolase [Candidatus Polarisedimenticolia bacterium]
MAAGSDLSNQQLERLTLAALTCQVRIGVTEEERSAPQRVDVDLDLYAELYQAGRIADLGLTIDYREVSDRVRALLEGRTFNLVEVVAVAIIDLVFERFRPVRRVAVRVRKYVLPNVAYVEVAMERRR